MRAEEKMWWRQAREDLDSAEANFRINKFYLVVFLCQQAVEKGLKAYFFKVKKANPGPTHSLIHLAVETKFPRQYMVFLRKLTPQFVNTRYPDAAYGVPSEIYDQELALEFLEKTREVMGWLASRMKK